MQREQTTAIPNQIDTDHKRKKRMRMVTHVDTEKPTPRMLMQGMRLVTEASNAGQNANGFWKVKLNHGITNLAIVSGEKRNKSASERKN